MADMLGANPLLANMDEETKRQLLGRMQEAIQNGIPAEHVIRFLNENAPQIASSMKRPESLQELAMKVHAPALSAYGMAASLVEPSNENLVALPLSFATGPLLGKAASAMFPRIFTSRLAVEFLADPAARTVTFDVAKKAGLEAIYGSMARITEEPGFATSIAKSVGMALPFSAMHAAEASENGDSPAGAAASTIGTFAVLDSILYGAGALGRMSSKLLRHRMTEAMFAKTEVGDQILNKTLMTIKPRDMGAAAARKEARAKADDLAFRSMSENAQVEDLARVRAYEADREVADAALAAEAKKKQAAADKLYEDNLLQDTLRLYGRGGEQRARLEVARQMEKKHEREMEAVYVEDVQRKLAAKYGGEPDTGPHVVGQALETAMGRVRRESPPAAQAIEAAWPQVLEHPSVDRESPMVKTLDNAMNASTKPDLAMSTPPAEIGTGSQMSAPKPEVMKVVDRAVTPRPVLNAVESRAANDADAALQTRLKAMGGRGGIPRSPEIESTLSAKTRARFPTDTFPGQEVTATKAISRETKAKAVQSATTGAKGELRHEAAAGEKLFVAAEEYAVGEGKGGPLDVRLHIAKIVDVPGGEPIAVPVAVGSKKQLEAAGIVFGTTAHKSSAEANALVGRYLLRMAEIAQGKGAISAEELTQVRDIVKSSLHANPDALRKAQVPTSKAILDTLARRSELAKADAKTSLKNKKLVTAERNLKKVGAQEGGTDLLDRLQGRKYDVTADRLDAVLPDMTPERRAELWERFESGGPVSDAEEIALERSVTDAADIARFERASLNRASLKRADDIMELHTLPDELKDPPAIPEARPALRETFAKMQAGDKQAADDFIPQLQTELAYKDLNLDPSVSVDDAFQFRHDSGNVVRFEKDELPAALDWLEKFDPSDEELINRWGADTAAPAPFKGDSCWLKR